MQHLSVRTVFGTILTLSAIEVVASSSAAAGRVGGAFQGLGTVARYLMSPSVPLVPDLRPKVRELRELPTVPPSQSGGLNPLLLPPAEG